MWSMDRLSCVAPLLSPGTRLGNSSGQRTPVSVRRSPCLNALVGGWNLSPIVTWRSGRFLEFGGMVANGESRIDDPGPARWFNTEMCPPLPNYTHA
jgi:hypothetical protein